MRVFLDANILLSGAIPNSRMRRFLDFLMRKGECLTNAYVVEEARRNLERKNPAALENLDQLVHQCRLVRVVQTEIPVPLVLKDVPILSGALAGLADYLLTGDEKDFGKYYGQSLAGVKVVSPRMLAEELTQSAMRLSASSFPLGTALVSCNFGGELFTQLDL